MKDRDRRQFNKLIANLGLIKIPMTECQYTWSSMRIKPNMAKLDRVFVSPEWKTKFSFALHILCEDLPRITYLSN